MQNPSHCNADQNALWNCWMELLEGSSLGIWDLALNTEEQTWDVKATCALMSKYRASQLAFYSLVIFMLTDS